MLWCATKGGGADREGEAMTKRHLEKLARDLRVALHCATSQEYRRGITDAVYIVTWACADDNPRFDRTGFLKAVGLYMEKKTSQHTLQRVHEQRKRLAAAGFAAKKGDTQ